MRCGVLFFLVVVAACAIPESSPSWRTVGVVASDMEQGRQLMGRGLVKEAIEHYKRAADNMPPGIAGAAEVTIILATALAQGGREKEAEQLLRSLTMQSPQPPTAIASLARLRLAEVLYTQMRCGEAVSLLDQFRRSPQDMEQYAVASSVLTLVHLARNNVPEAKVVLTEALARTAPQLGAGHGLSVQLRAMQGRIKSLSLSDNADAEELLVRARADLSKLLGPEHPTVIDVTGCLSDEYRPKKRYEESAALREKVLSFMERERAADTKAIQFQIFRLAVTYGFANNEAKALELFQRELAIEERVNGQGTPAAGQAWINIATSHRILSDCPRSRAAALRAEAIFTTAYGPRHQKALEAQVLHQQGPCALR